MRERERGNIIYYYFIVGCRDNGKKYLHHETVSLITINNIVSSPFPPSFEQFDSKPKAHPFIDIWPLCVRFNEEFENTFTLMMQLACVLHMKDTWKSSTTIRIFVLTENTSKWLC